MKVVFLGATRGMGRALARRMAEQGASLFLLGRDRVELERSAKDLELHGAHGDVGSRSATCSRPPASRRRSSAPTPRSAASTPP